MPGERDKSVAGKSDSSNTASLSYLLHRINVPVELSTFSSPFSDDDHVHPDDGDLYLRDKFGEHFNEPWKAVREEQEQQQPQPQQNEDESKKWLHDTLVTIADMLEEHLDESATEELDQLPPLHMLDVVQNVVIKHDNIANEAIVLCNTMPSSEMPVRFWTGGGIAMPEGESPLQDMSEAERCAMERFAAAQDVESVLPVFLGCSHEDLVQQVDFVELPMPPEDIEVERLNPDVDVSVLTPEFSMMDIKDGKKLDLTEAREEALQSMQTEMERLTLLLEEQKREDENYIRQLVTECILQATEPPTLPLSPPPTREVSDREKFNTPGPLCTPL